MRRAQWERRYDNDELLGSEPQDADEREELLDQQREADRSLAEERWRRGPDRRTLMRVGGAQ